MIPKIKLSNNFHSGHFIFFLLIVLVFSGCKKDDKACNAAESEIAAPFSSPVWHPNGELIGFNYQPLARVDKVGSGSCISYNNVVKTDSIGFYIMHKNGTGLQRVTNYLVKYPSWSPSGSTLVFAYQNNIYSLPFDGAKFDTARRLKLTNVDVNTFPSWDSTGKYIVYQVDDVGNYLIRMSPDGSDKERLTYKGTQPFVGSNDKVYHIGGPFREIMTALLNSPLTNPTQITGYTLDPNAPKSPLRHPRYYRDTVFFIHDVLSYRNSLNGNKVSLGARCESYDVSPKSEIVYQTLDYQPDDKRYSTIWTMKTDGSNKKQITYNSY